MKVKDLIALLLKEDQDKIVQIKGDYNGTFILARTVREGKHRFTKGDVCITGEKVT